MEKLDNQQELLLMTLIRAQFDEPTSSYRYDQGTEGARLIELAEKLNLEKVWVEQMKQDFRTYFGRPWTTFLNEWLEEVDDES